MPLAVLFPVEWAVLGPRAVHCTSIAGLCGLVLVELHMAESRRIPFTCSYEPSRQFVGLTMLIGVAAFVVFTMVGSRLVSYSISHPVGWLALMTILSACMAVPAAPTPVAVAARDTHVRRRPSQRSRAAQVVRVLKSDAAYAANQHGGTRQRIRKPALAAALSRVAKAMERMCLAFRA